MTLNREDGKSAIPQLEKRINELKALLTSTQSDVSKLNLDAFRKRVEARLGVVDGEIVGLNNELEEEVERATGAEETLQAIVDNTIETWFYDGVPTLSNLPASQWTTETLKERHKGDMYYDNSTGYAYRFLKTDGVYGWTRLSDSAVVEALALAGAKKRIFVNATPTVPYDVGDLWCTTSGDTKVCTTARATGTYTASDWVKSSNYTDDTLAQTAKNTADQAVSDASAAQSSANAAQTSANNAQTSANNAQDAADAAQDDATQALSDASAAQSSANAAQTTADDAQEYAEGVAGDLNTETTRATTAEAALGTRITTAQTTAEDAIASANGKNTNYYQSSQPTGGTYTTGDTWFDTDDDNKMYEWNGSSWVAITFGENAITDDSISTTKIKDAAINNAKIANLDAGKITTGTLSADRIAATSITIGKLGTDVTTTINAKANSSDLSEVATSGEYSDLTGSPTKVSDFTNDSNFQTATQVSTTVNNHHDDTKANTDDLSAVATSGDYSDLNGSPTKLSDFTNDENYQTGTQVSTTVNNHHDSTKYDASNPSGYTDDTKANAAQTTANAAQTTANNAQSSANAAQSDATQALSDASDAQDTADTAESHAQTAISNAATAQSSANAAQSTANSASSAAATAQTTANNAQDTADTANDTVASLEEDLSGTMSEVEAIDSTLTQQSSEITTVKTNVATLTERSIDELVYNGYAAITALPSIELGKETSDWKVVITNSAINLTNAGFVVGSLAEDTERANEAAFIAANAKFSNLKLRSTNGAGVLGIVAQSNGHVSLKEI